VLKTRGDLMTPKSGRKKRTRDRVEKGRNVPSPPGSEEKAERAKVHRKWYFLLALIMFVVLASYSNGVRNQFVFDDTLVISNNPTIRGIEKIPRLLGMGKKKASYRPLRTISYAVDYTLNQKLWKYMGIYEGRDEGLNPFGYHIANYVYHLLTTWLVFLVVFRLASNYRIAFLAAALFALHPVHTDSVTYLSGRRDIFVTLFYLAGFYFFLRYRQTRNLIFILAAFLSYILSLGSKELGVTLPALFFCYDLITHFPEKVRKIDAAYFKALVLTVKKVLVQSKYLYSLLFLGALSFSYYKVFIKSPSYKVTYYGDSMITTFLTVGKILVHYIKLLVYPIRLNADYSFNAFPLSSSFLEPATVVSFMVLGVIGYVVLRLVITHRIAAFGVIWFFVTLLPVCHIFPHHELLAEHYLYLPSFGVCLAVAYGLNRFLEEKRYRYYIYAICSAVVLLFSVRIADRNRDWKDTFTLWQKTIKTAPQCARAHSNLGLAYYNKAMYDEAISLYKKASTIAPNYAQVHFNLGLTYDKKGMLDEAIVEYESTISLSPRYTKAYNNLAWIYATSQNETIRNGDRAVSLAIKACELSEFKNAKYLDTLAAAYAKQGNLGKALEYQVKALARASMQEKQQFQERLDSYPTARIVYDSFKVLSVKPSLADSAYYSEFVYDEKEELDKAISAYKKKLDMNPRSAGAHNNLGVAYVRKGELWKASDQFGKALKSNPKLAEAYVGYGVALAKMGGLDLAIYFFKGALAINPTLSEAHNNLVSTYYLKGDYDAALYHCGRVETLGHKISPQLLELLKPYR
jgi:tetratricopeptide (TPR) repeat protein